MRRLKEVGTFIILFVVVTVYIILGMASAEVDAVKRIHGKDITIWQVVLHSKVR